MKPAMTNFAVRAAPALFVVLWSTGFIATKLALSGAEPLTWLTLRMTITICLLLVIVGLTGARWPRGRQILHSAVAGLLVHGVYLAGVTLAIGHSIPAGLSALIPGLQPILTSTLASRFLGERVTPLQWGGLLLGLVGVLLVLHNRSLSGQAGWGMVASVASLIGITLGTLYQKRFSGQIDWRTGNIVQYAAAGVCFGIGALLFEDRTIHWHAQFVLAAAWSTLVLSVGSIALLYWLIRRSGATQMASLFYLVPAVTAVFAFLLFDERLDAISLAGMLLCAVGVVIVNRASAR
ncbi:DMT family transporter [Bradyrhizobium sp. 2TAF24]|uniref:DMT family transporter n=1 Tax=Bradyrhizobium sp. 2TAF24 TaxID=3233011 RepID=UPI003F8F9447